VENRRQKTEKNICFIFLKLIFFWRARRGKIGGEKNEKKIFTQNMEAWSLENRRQKKLKKHINF
jgi:hypothetical protein